MKRLWMFGGDLIVETGEDGASTFAWFAMVVDFELAAPPVEEWRQRVLDQIDKDLDVLVDVLIEDLWDARPHEDRAETARALGRSVLKRTVQ